MTERKIRKLRPKMIRKQRPVIKIRKSKMTRRLMKQRARMIRTRRSRVHKRKYLMKIIIENVSNFG